MRTFDAVLWDMDGVLLDSEPLSSEAVALTCRRNGLSVPEDLKMVVLGRRDQDIFAEMLRGSGGPLNPVVLAQETSRAYLELLGTRSLEPRPGVREALDQFRAWGLKQAVASSSSPERIRANVKHLGIQEVMDELVSGWDVPRGKPHPDIFLTTAEKLGVAPGRCLVIEDSDPGVQAALAAGMTCVAFPCSFTRHQRHQGAVLRVEDLRTVDWSRLMKWESGTP